jgi:hypothetical protein
MESFVPAPVREPKVAAGQETILATALSELFAER